MKRRIIFLTLVLLALPTSKALASDCLDLFQVADGWDMTLQDVFTNYTTHATTKNTTEGIYEICFMNSWPTDQAFNISTSGNDKLVIKNLNLTTTNLSTPLLTLSGSNITLDNVTLTGNGNGTAVQVNGANMVIQSSTIDNFATGIQVNGDNAEIKGPNMSIHEVSIGIDPGSSKNISIGDIDFTKDVQQKIKAKYFFDLNWVGKKCDVRKKVTKGDKEYEICDNSLDVTNILKVTGKPPLGVQDCAGNVAVAKSNMNNNAVEKIMECQLKPVAKEDAPIWFVKYVNNELEVQEIKEGKCSFVCELGANKTLTIKDQVSLSFNNELALFTATKAEDPSVPDGISSALYKTFDDSADVPSTGLGGTVIGATVSGATKDTVSGDDPVVAPVIFTGPSTDPGTGQPKASTDDGGLVNQESGGGGCSGSSVMGNYVAQDFSPAGSIGRSKDLHYIVTFLFALLALVPIAGRRFFRQRL